MKADQVAHGKWQPKNEVRRQDTKLPHILKLTQIQTNKKCILCTCFSQVLDAKVVFQLIFLEHQQPCHVNHLLLKLRSFKSSLWHSSWKAAVQRQNTPKMQIATVQELRPKTVLWILARSLRLVISSGIPSVDQFSQTTSAIELSKKQCVKIHVHCSSTFQGYWKDRNAWWSEESHMSLPMTSNHSLILILLLVTSHLIVQQHWLQWHGFLKVWSQHCGADECSTT